MSSIQRTGFTVFLDDAPAVNASSNSASSSAKENLHPVTGTRVLSDQSLGKRRKTIVALKAQPSSPSKRPRPLAEKPVKKPSTSKSRSAEKKTKRPSTTKRSSTRTGREPSLPRLVEESEEQTALTQEEIDSKCKELTVLPLADISEAYEQAIPKEESASAPAPVQEEKVVVAAVPALSDNKVERAVTPPPAEPIVASKEPSSPAVSTTGGAFSTPERKRIYSAFTFESPSPASSRYVSARGSSVERFSDVAF